MPGNEVGDRIHNFLGQQSFSQGHHHSQVIDNNFTGLSNNLWVGNQRQVSNFKNYGVQQQLAETDRGDDGQSSSVQHGINFIPPALRPEIARSQSQNQSPIGNGYIQGHQPFQARQEETDFLSVGTASRGLSAFESQIGNGPDFHKKNLMRLESNESPVNYDFFGGQQQISGQHPAMIQPLARQQSGMIDLQMLQQHAMLKQMQKLQRQQLQKQLQLQETGQLNSANQVSSVVKHGTGNHSPAPINGVPVHDASNYSWQPEHITPSANWVQNGASPAMQGSSSGFVFSPEQGQVRLMGLIPQQVDQSFYGISSSSARGNPYQYSPVQMDKSIMQQVPMSSNSFPGNQYAMFSDQVGLQDGISVPGQGSQGNVFGAAASQGLNSGFHSENLQKMTIPSKNAVMQESLGRQEHPGPSETSMEKSVIQAAPSQNVAALDPTEEKILFGSDDNAWDMFGRTDNMGSMLDSTDSFGTFPSLQSGSWSALMQSAVAETSSNDNGLQGEWSGLDMQNSEPPNGNLQSSVINDGSKQQSAWTLNDLQTNSTTNSKTSPMSTDANINNDFCNVPRAPGSGVQSANEQIGRMQNDLSQRSVQQLPEGRNNWLDRGPLQKPAAESGQMFRNIVQSPDMQVHAKSGSGYQQSIAAYSPRDQPHHKPNSWNFIESASNSAGAVLKDRDMKSSSQASQSSAQKGAMHEKRGHGSAVDHPFSNANFESGIVNSNLGSPQVNREESDLNNVAGITDSSSRIAKDGGQELPNSHNLNLWKSIDSRGNSGSGKVPSKYLQNQDKGPVAFDSSGYNCLDKGTSETNMLENPNVKETSNDGFRSNLSLHTSAGGLRESVWLDANDSRAGKQKSSVQISRKSSGSRKFQYHPMGDLDAEVEPYYGHKSVTHSQPHVSQGFKAHDRGHFGQSKATCHSAGESTRSEKGHFPGIQVDGVPSKILIPGSAPDRSSNAFMPNKKSAPLSQNMLELLQKVDQPRDRGATTNLSSSECNLSSEKADVDTSDGSMGQFQQRSSVSQSFGLQLGLPSQKLPFKDRAISSQSSSPGINSLNSATVTPDVGRTHMWLGPGASVQPSTHGTSHEVFRDDISNASVQMSNKASQYSTQFNVSAGFTSDYPHLKSIPQSQHVTGVASQVNESVSANYGGVASQLRKTYDPCDRGHTSQLGGKLVPHIQNTASDNDVASPSEISRKNTSNHSHARDLHQQFPVLEAMPVSEPSALSESSRQGALTKISPDVWNSVSAPQQLEVQTSRGSQNLFNLNPQSSINPETTFPVAKKLEDQITQAGGSGLSEFPGDTAKPQRFVGEDQPAEAQQVSSENGASQNLAATPRDIEAFGRSLRSCNAIHQNYSLLHQVQAMKNLETDPNGRSAKRFRGSDSGLDAQQASTEGVEKFSHLSDAMKRDASVNHPLIPPADSKMLSFSANTGDNCETHLSSNNILACAKNDSKFANGNSSAANLRAEQSKISPQMAPSWFDRYGTFKNGQMLPTYDARGIAMMKAAEKLGRQPSDNLHGLQSSENVNSAADACQLDNARQNSNLMPIPIGHISHRLVPPDIANQNLAIVRTNKRKSITVDLLPWHREVMQGSQRPQTLSAGEVEWAHATNRLIEKVEDEPEQMMDDWSQLLRSKRRLILTTQLMQQLLCAPPRIVLSVDASKNYESVAYCSARSALGDACGTSLVRGIDTAVPLDNGSIMSEDHKMSEKNGNQFIIKAAEEFLNRIKKLENNLQSVDKRTSILDLRVELQDLEKFSVINRFAKFHGRGQADGVESSSSSDAIATAHKVFPQRYVTALQMPRNVPDSVQCLSL